MAVRQSANQVTRYADMFAAIGAEPRLRIMQLLLAAHPTGMVVSSIQEEEILDFLYAECCTRSKAIKPGELVSIGRASGKTRERTNK